MSFISNKIDHIRQNPYVIRDYFEYFLLYCFLGWIYESIWCDVIYHKRGFLNRGFLFGPWLPIYGIGFFIILGLFHLLKIKKPAPVKTLGMSARPLVYKKKRAAIIQDAASIFSLVYPIRAFGFFCAIRFSTKFASSMFASQAASAGRL
ncbi:hypothetical protein CPT75_01050 (plasmid) [Butyrivibrio fibrisolvens]|uniref:Uncharacterized protein n=1 Tax=Butyrivibrio fibrisolvens TaxID=831 RepID=A0A317G0Y5_BUTFI|nr:hypothetical protein CPT75_01050 [Butyrivibrio fibrisolvens]